MNRIEQLIEELCPEGVECQMLVDVAKILYGFPFQSNMFTDDEKYIPLIRIRDIKQGKGSIYFKGSFSSEFIIKRGDMIVGMDGDFNLNKWNDRDSILNQRVCKIESKNENITNNNYLFHLLIPLFKKIESETSGSTVKHLSAKAINNISIPIPPLPIQQEIVNILDTFTALDASLQAELEARRKQYKHYRNQLLNFEGKEVEWKTLGEIGEFVRGNGLQKKDFTESGVGCIHYGQIYTYYGFCTNKTKSFVSPEFAKKLKKAQKGNLIIATTSENVEDVCKSVVWLGDEDICISGETYIFKHNQNPKYLAYYLQTPLFFDYKKQNVTGTKVIRLHGDKLEKFTIPIPSLSEQERIVGILDKFDALVNTELPAEIAARRKQYEYYREKLLTFEPLAN